MKLTLKLALRASAVASALALVGVAAAAPGGGAATADDTTALERARGIERAIVEVTSRTSPAFVVIGGGSGIVVSADGFVLTNHHVAGTKAVGGTWRVKLPGTGIVEAKVVGHDPHGDISLLKLEGKGPFAHVDLADSDDLKVGDFALVLGNPFGYSKDSTPTVSVGVVSAIHRFKEGYSDAIQTDAAINPGNSGGQLLNERGELVGINGRIDVRYGTKINTGVGYAIPSNQIKSFLDRFKKEGIVHHATVSGLAKIANTRDGGEGAVVEAVTNDSTAAKAGIRKGDVVVELDGRRVSNVARLLGIVGTIPAGDTVKVKVRRGDETIETQLALDKAEGDEADGEAPLKTNGAWLGISMATADEGGVQITEVTEGSPAEKAGLKKGDVITSFAKRKVTNVNELVARLARRKPAEKVELKLKRDGKTVTVEITLAKKPAEEDD